jgi:hypothetical protein
MWWYYLGATIIVVIIISILGLKRFINVFFAYKDDKSNDSLGKKGSKTVVAAGLYSAYHYWVVVPVAIGLVTTMKNYGFTYWLIFAIMWIFNAANGMIVLKVNDLSNKDMTLSEGSRRVVDATISKNNFAGILSETWMIFKLTFWDGPAELVIFLQPRLREHKELAVIMFLVAAGIQMLLWVVVYIKGYDNLSKLF